MTTSEILAFLKTQERPYIKFAFADIDGVLRGKLISTKKMIDTLESGVGFCDVAFGWDSSDNCYDEKITITGWNTGYPDRNCFIDPSTFRTIPWQDGLPFFIADYSNAQGAGFDICPRTILKRVKQQATAMGFHAEYAQEFEWFNFSETPKSLEQKHYIKPEPLTPGMFGYSILRPSAQSAYYFDLFNLLHDFDIPIEGLHTETGPGVYEAAIDHDEILKAADRAVLFKNSVKEIAARHGIMASFMAKWNEELPGCGGHIHQSIWNLDQSQNLFYDATDKDGISELMKQFIAGQLYCLPHILPMYAPTINSFKRLVEGAWAPVTLTWAFDNRTTALRVLRPSPQNTRLEMRVPGSDCNPYLAMAASLASGLYGVKNKLALPIEPSVGNAYEDLRNGKIPANLYEAAKAMKHSAVAKALFGEVFVDHFSETRLWEWKQFMLHVTDWEMKRYFEII